MSNHHSANSSGDSQSTPSKELSTPSTSARRERLATLIGRLLARHWLREKRSRAGKKEETQD